MRLVLFLLFISFLQSCDTEKRQSLFTPKFGPSIVGGVEVPRTNEMASFTVALYDRKLGFVCTGSLIENNLILTAAHCIESQAADLVLVFDLNFDGLDSNNPAVLRKVLTVEIHPGFADHESRNLDWDDIAVVTFEGSLPKGYSPVQILQDSSLLKRGDAVFMAGFGAEKVELEDVTKRDKKFRKDLETGEVVCSDKSLTHCYRLNYLGLDLLRSTSATIEGFTEKEIRLNENKGHGTCVGDSGGPLLIQIDGKYKLIGVTSRGSEFCDGPAVYTNAIEYRDWIPAN